MYVYIYINTWICMYLYIYIYIYLYLHMNICTHEYVCVYIYIHMQCSHVVKSVDFAPDNKSLLCAGKFKKLKVNLLKRLLFYHSGLRCSSSCSGSGKLNRKLSIENVHQVSNTSDVYTMQILKNQQFCFLLICIYGKLNIELTCQNVHEDF